MYQILKKRSISLVAFIVSTFAMSLSVYKMGVSVITSPVAIHFSAVISNQVIRIEFRASLELSRRVLRHRTPRKYSRQYF